jgi:ATP-binding cassette subfamily F protein 3
MIQIQEVSKAYGSQVVLNKISFVLNKKEKCGLVGRNGSGKTTLFRLIAGDETLDSGLISIPKGYRLGLLRQHHSFTKDTILDEACEALPAEDKDSVYKAETILFGLGFNDEDMDRPPSVLSGGYHLRLSLAKVLISEPDCLLLDEPSNYLDIISLRWLENFLRSWRREMLLITHDREFMTRVTSHTIGINRQKGVKVKGGPEELFKLILEKEQLHEKSRVKIEKQKAHAQDFIRRLGAKASKAKQAQSRVKQINRMPVLEQLAAIDDLGFKFKEAPFPSQRVLQAEGLSFSYDDEPLIDELSLEMEKEECIAIIGKNGRGKSTVLRLLSGDLEALEGNIKLSPHVKVGYFGQTNIDTLDGKATIIEEISRANPHTSYSEVRAICGAMLFSDDLAKKRIEMLSGGEKSRVLLGKILATPCNVLLLDEPTHHLDMESIEALMTALEEFSGCVIMVTHTELILHRLPLTQLLVCKDAEQINFTGDYQDFLDKMGWENDPKAAKKLASGKQKLSKKRRAELVQEKSKALRGVKQSMEEYEKEIMKLEPLIEKKHKELVKLAEDGADGGKIQELSIICAKDEKRVEELFELLDKINQKEAAIHEQFKEISDL